MNKTTNNNYRYEGQYWSQGGCSVLTSVHGCGGGCEAASGCGGNGFRGYTPIKLKISISYSVERNLFYDAY